MARAKSFGSRLYELRKRVPLTQRQLADIMGVDFTYISKIESGSAPPPARDRIERATTALDLSADEAEELFRLAEKIPSDATSLIAKQPGALRLLRSIRQTPASDQEALLEELIRRVEARHRARHRGGD
jgi:transcriptional regulator with XRE-family HTH domain